MDTERPDELRVPQLRKIVFQQMVWFMFWPFLTVMLVVGSIYLDRMHNLKEMATRHESLRLHTIGHAVASRLQFFASDLSLAANDPLFLNYLPENAEQVKKHFAHFLTWKKEYLAIHLLDSSGSELFKELGSLAQTGQTHHKKHRLLPPSALTLPQGSIFIIYSPFESERTISQSAEAEVLSLGCVSGEKSSKHFLIIDLPLTALFETLGNGLPAESRLFFTDNRNATLWRVAESVEADKSNTGVVGALLVPDDLPGNSLEKIRNSLNEQKQGSFFRSDNLYIFTKEEPFSAFSQKPQATTAATGESITDSSSYQLLLISEISSNWFLSQRSYYIRFLLVLAVALLIPSFVVCFFLAKARIRVLAESALRNRERLSHLEDLEHKVQQRTRALDDSNLQLSAEIAERLSTEKQLKRSNELLSGMLGSIDGIIYVADFDTHEILFANDYLKRLFGFDPVGRQCWQFIHSNQEGPCEFCTNRKLLDEEGEPTGSYQWEYQNPFNKKWYAAKDQAIKWSNGKYVRLEIALDITEQKQLQHFLKEARKQADITEGTRRRFMALVAHDLKSPFFSITQMLRRILERETFTHRVHRRFLENIVENGHRMLQMIDNLLSMDRFETGEVKLEKSFFDVSEMADEVLKNFKHLAFEKGVKLINEIPPGLCIFADKYLYFVVLNNLVSNAVKFSDRGGCVTIYVPYESRQMTIAVKDRGKGMSREYLQDIFKADVKTSSQGTKGEKGSGLGLIFCQDILKVHKGQISVTSERHVGTVFFVELPECSQLHLKEIT